MTPSIETRLKAIIGALEHLVLPALANADSIVQEQAALSLGHLKIIVMQLPHVDLHHAMCLAEQLSLGRDLLSCVEGGSQTTAAADALRETVAGAADGGNAKPARDLRNTVAMSISALVIASSIDASPAFLTASQDILIDHGLRQSRRDRAWYGPTGLDPFVAELPSIEELVAEERAELNREAA